MGGALSKEEAETWLATPRANQSVLLTATLDPPEKGVLEWAYDSVFSLKGASGTTYTQERLGECTLGYAEVGSEDPEAHVVLFFCGLGGSRYVAKLFEAEALRHNHRVFVIEAPGIGKSSRVLQEPDNRTTHENWRDLVCNFVDQVVDGAPADRADCLSSLHRSDRRARARDLPRTASSEQEQEQSQEQQSQERTMGERRGERGRGGGRDGAREEMSSARAISLCGFSAGGLLAMLAASDPWLSPRIRSLVLVAPWIPPSWEGAPLRSRLGGHVPGFLLSAASGVIPSSVRFSVSNASAETLAKHLGLADPLARDAARPADHRHPRGEIAAYRGDESGDGGDRGDRGDDDRVDDGDDGDDDDDGDGQGHDGISGGGEGGGDGLEGWAAVAKATVNEASRAGNGGFGQVLNLCLERHGPIPQAQVTPEITAPRVLIVAAEKDEMVTVESLRCLCNAIPRATMDVVPQLNHDTIGALCARHVFDFLARA